MCMYRFSGPFAPQEAVPDILLLRSNDTSGQISQPSILVWFAYTILRLPPDLDPLERDYLTTVTLRV